MSEHPPIYRVFRFGIGWLDLGGRSPVENDCSSCPLCPYECIFIDGRWKCLSARDCLKETNKP